MAKLQKEKVVNFRGEKDVAHGIESLWEDVEKALPYIENKLEHDIYHYINQKKSHVQLCLWRTIRQQFESILTF